MYRLDPADSPTARKGEQRRPLAESRPSSSPTGAERLVHPRLSQRRSPILASEPRVTVLAREFTALCQRAGGRSLLGQSAAARVRLSAEAGRAEVKALAVAVLRSRDHVVVNGSTGVLEPVNHRAVGQDDFDERRVAWCTRRSEVPGRDVEGAGDATITRPLCVEAIVGGRGSRAAHHQRERENRPST